MRPEGGRPDDGVEDREVEPQIEQRDHATDLTAESVPTTSRATWVSGRPRARCRGSGVPRRAVTRIQAASPTPGRPPTGRRPATDPSTRRGPRGRTVGASLRPMTRRRPAGPGAPSGLPEGQEEPDVTEPARTNISGDREEDPSQERGWPRATRASKEAPAPRSRPGSHRVGPAAWGAPGSRPGRPSRRRPHADQPGQHPEQGVDADLEAAHPGHHDGADRHPDQRETACRAVGQHEQIALERKVRPAQEPALPTHGAASRGDSSTSTSAASRPSHVHRCRKCSTS